MSYKIVATKEDQTMRSVRQSLRIAAAKARAWAREGWEVVVTDGEERTLDPADFENWLREQTQDLPEPDVSPEFLAAQRRSIYRRIESPQHARITLRWGLSVGMLLLLVAGGVTLERHRAGALE